MKMSKEQSTMILRAISWMISDLQYERHQALCHGCTGGSYDKEIEEYRKLKTQIINEGI